MTYISEAELTLNAVMNKQTEFSSGGIIIEPICVSSDCNTDARNGPDRITFKVCQNAFLVSVALTTFAPEPGFIHEASYGEHPLIFWDYWALAVNTVLH